MHTAPPRSFTHTSLSSSFTSRTPFPVSQSKTIKHVQKLDLVLNNNPRPRPLPLHFTTNCHSDILNNLDLSDVLPAGKKVSEISPTRLTHIRSFLSTTSPKPSPRRCISNRWQQLHGSKDWEGLLDPLDEDLRREVLRYGEHVHAAYHAFLHTDQNRLSPAPGDDAYRVTSNLYATSSIHLPTFFPPQQQSSWIGYVAICDCPNEIRRIGRRDIVIALRGTTTCLEWIENFRNRLVPVDSEDKLHRKVENGFLSLFQTTPTEEENPTCQKSLSDSATEEVIRLIKAYPNEKLSITITGHSLGAALALLVADKLTTAIDNCNPLPITVFSFGGPRVGNGGFADTMYRRGVKVLRVVNEHDLVTRVPGVFANEVLDHRAHHDGTVVKRLLETFVGKVNWTYTHVGSELRVDSRQSPYLRDDADMACCHDLEAYLHLVDGCLGSGSPFRCNAKRSILRCLSQQSADMKKIMYKIN